MGAIDAVVGESTRQVVNNHPKIAIFVIAMCVATLLFGMWWAGATFADKGEIDKVKDQVASVRDQTAQLTQAVRDMKRGNDRGQLEASIRSLDVEVYALQRKADSNKADDEDLRRLDAQKAKLAAKKRELVRLDLNRPLVDWDIRRGVEERRRGDD